MMRYLVADDEAFENRRFRFVYDTLYKRFIVVEKKSDSYPWTFVKNAGSNFYIYMPGFAKRLRESDSIPKWARQRPAIRAA